MISFNGNSAKLLSKVDVRVLRETKDQNYTVEYGRILDYKPGSDTLIVENQETGKVNKWPKKQCIGVLDYAEKKEKQLDIAAASMSKQNAIINALIQENKELGGELGTKLDKINQLYAKDAYTKSINEMNKQLGGVLNIKLDVIYPQFNMKQYVNLINDENTQLDKTA